ncbi:MAG: hypothetical protein DIU72_001395 [Pseudomonadota bacterium]|nr:MAG: hypothetical protein DIU72_08175 [Pseudomonadota bacterium]
MRRWAPLVLLLLAGCASHSLLPDEDRIRLERSLPGRTYYLRQAMYLGPFWSDESKRFLSANVPDEIPWVVNPAGVPLDPGEPEAIVPVGTRVRVVKIEFPTSFVVARRDPFLPRFYPWVYLEVEGRPRNPAPILLLRRELRSQAEVVEDLERYLSPDDLRPRLRSLPEEVLEAINEKRLVEGMPAEAVEMAWGIPEQKRFSPSPEGRVEEWIWPFERRRARIVGGRLVSWVGEAPRVPVTAP